MPNYCTVKYIDKTLASASSLQQALLQISVPILAGDNLQLVKIPTVSIWLVVLYIPSIVKHGLHDCPALSCSGEWQIQFRGGVTR